MPFFAGLLTYPNNEPLYNLLHVPPGYDPERTYPLCVRFQPQGSAPGVGEFVKMANGQAFVLGVSWPLSRPFQTGGGLSTLTSQDYFVPATVHWVLSNFSIDRSRIFVGGFSAGGWSASSQGMTPAFEHLSTRFVIMGAGLRGKFKTRLFKGSAAFVAAGMQGMNHGSAKAAASKLRKSGFEVTFVEEDGVGHAIGPKMWQALGAWYKSLDTREHAADWMARAQAMEKKDKAGAAELYARVAALGPKNEHGKAARARLEEIEGEALASYEAARDLMDRGFYAHAKKAFARAGRTAAKKRVRRLISLCKAGIVEAGKRQFMEQAMAMEMAYFSGRPYESWLLAQDGAARYLRQLKTWVRLFKSESKNKKLIDAATAAARREPKRAKAQQKLVRARTVIWSAGPKSKFKTVRKDLAKIETDFAGKPEGTDAKTLLATLDALEKQVSAGKR